MDNILPFAQFITHEDGSWELQILHKDVPKRVINLYLEEQKLKEKNNG